MTHIVSNRLVCGNCVHPTDVTINFQKFRWCQIRKGIVMNYDACCVGFTWSGETTPDGQLLLFPREVQPPLPLNA